MEEDYDRLSVTRTMITMTKKQDKMEGAMAICWAASQGDIYELQRLVACGVNLNDADYDGRTGIHLAASEGHEDTVKFFINKKVDVNSRDRWGGTPLTDAKRSNHKKVVELLEKHGGT